MTKVDGTKSRITSILFIDVKLTNRKINYNTTSKHWEDKGKWDKGVI